MTDKAFEGLEIFIHGPSYILVVEDDTDMREHLGLLIEEPHKVLYASNGQEALSVLSLYAVDLIVSDIGMHIMDGFKFLKHLRQEKEDLTPFLFLTAHAEKTAVMEALLLGVDAYLIKPFESAEFLARINGLLNNNKGRKEAYIQGLTSCFETDDASEEEENTSFRSKWLKELEGIVNKEIDNPNIRVPDLAYKIAASERTFINRIRRYTGLSPHEYLMEARMTKALQLFEKGIYFTVAEVANAVGLENNSYFTMNFKERFGRAPLI